MKKIFSFVIACVFAFALVSCSSVESKAKDFVKDEYEAVSKLNFSKALKIEKEAKDYRESLSDEDKEIFDKAYEEAETEYAAKLKEKAGDVVEGIGSALDDALNGIANDYDSSDEESSEN